ncbi:hypothetical protein H0H93_005307 [Arthromyces matolae]|nr:hypothetical protein H0H93_005307 [Arthromyces matolae]
MLSTPIRPRGPAAVDLDVESSPRTIIRAARQLQLDNTNLMEELNEARKQLADVMNSRQPIDDEDNSEVATPAAKKRKDDSNWEEEAQKAGKKFVLVCGPWLEGVKPKDIFKIAIDEQYSHDDRFENLTTRIQGQLRDIQSVMSPAMFSEITGGDERLRRAVS